MAKIFLQTFADAKEKYGMPEVGIDAFISFPDGK